MPLRPAAEDLELLGAAAARLIAQHSRLAGRRVLGPCAGRRDPQPRGRRDERARIGDLGLSGWPFDNRDLAAGHLRLPAASIALVRAIDADGRKCWTSWQASLPEPHWRRGCG